MRRNLVRPRSVTRLAPLALAVVFAVGLAACGSSSDSSSDKTTTTSAAASGGGSTKAVVVKTADDASLGTILVDADGRTLYTLTDGGGTAVACTGGCLTAWPPALLPAGTTTATGSDGVTKLATTPSGSDLQVTHDGLPLYRFAADAAAGDAKGEGISSFGGTWHVVKIGGAASGSSTSTTAKNTSGY